ncbi:MAG: cupin domain-containing protein [Sphingobacteriales bacterium]|nr:cupin domain-containing protein [Sphingobacteriales bacterium]
MSNKTGPSEKFVLVDSIAYADKSVVSKTIQKKPTGNITLFAFDQGEGLSEHTTPYEALLQLVDGKAEITIGEHQYILQTGECIILPANIPHSVKANEKFKMMLTMIKS